MDEFKQSVWDYFRQNGRTFAWRQNINPYRVFVSEIMLQQTQTHRVAQKFDAFVSVLPDFQKLARAPFPVVLGLWQGLGYNRRAKYLLTAAIRIMGEYAGHLPSDPLILRTFDGIGPATSCSMVTFAFNKPTIFIETNIRAAFIHHFFKGQSNIADSQLMPLIEQALDQQNPRQWYYALIDYGVMLKQQFINPSRASKHYFKQSRFQGSVRQMRGHILQLLLARGKLELFELESLSDYDERLPVALAQLINEHFVCQDEHRYCLVHR